MEWNFRESPESIRREDVDCKMLFEKRERLGKRLTHPDVKCEFCKSSLASSPEIRRGPSGKNSLCNKVQSVHPHVFLICTSADDASVGFSADCSISGKETAAITSKK